MAIVRRKELKKFDQKELSTKLTELQLELAKQRASIGLGASVTSPGHIKQIRRTIAKIKARLSQVAEPVKEAKGTNG